MGYEFSPSPVSDVDDEMPSYKDRGRILVYVRDKDLKTRHGAQFDYEIIAYDTDASPFWIEEGEGIEHWCDGVSEIDGHGLWLIEDIEGDYIRGDGWTTDDDVDWYWGTVRKLTIAEALALDFGLSEEDLEGVE